jgi:hypothetical protein
LVLLRITISLHLSAACGLYGLELRHTGFNYNSAKLGANISFETDQHWTNCVQIGRWFM